MLVLAVSACESEPPLLSGPAAGIMKTAGDGQADVAGATLQSPLVVTVVDALQRPVPGAHVSFEVDAGGASLSNATAVTDVSGTASVMVTLGATRYERDTISAHVGSSLSTQFAVEAIPEFSAKLMPSMFGGTYGPPYTVIGDLNSDGRPDLAVTIPGSPPTPALFFNTTPAGAGELSFTESSAAGSGSWATIADFDGVPPLDLVELRGSGSGYVVSVVLNNTPQGATSAALATPVDVATIATWATVKVADVNGDGKPDLVYGTFEDASVFVAINTSTTTLSFSAPVQIALPNPALALEIADINQDGAPDIVVPTHAASAVPCSLTVLVNTTTTGAASPAFHTSSLGMVQSCAQLVSTPLAIGDVNGDGKDDVVVRDADKSAWVFLNTTSAASQDVAATLGELVVGKGGGIALGDVDGDGVLDVVSNDTGASQATPGNVTVYMNETSPGAGTPSFASALPYPVMAVTPDYNALSIAVADLNVDGRLDVLAGRYGGTGGVMLSLVAR